MAISCNLADIPCKAGNMCVIHQNPFTGVSKGNCHISHISGILSDHVIENNKMRFIIIKTIVTKKEPK
ncbi:hypothetical protein, partial [uncultured Anaerovibrio sp.]|uniref:hypothetical protein n=1 Tax=uncultured Anaerovibrio sp. TaxID=361586 RepID=UPI002614FE19